MQGLSYHAAQRGSAPSQAPAARSQIVNVKRQLQSLVPFNVDAVLSMRPDGRSNQYWSATLTAFWTILQEDEYDD